MILEYRFTTLSFVEWVVLYNQSWLVSNMNNVCFKFSFVFVNDEMINPLKRNIRSFKIKTNTIIGRSRNVLEYLRRNKLPKLMSIIFFFSLFWRKQHNEHRFIRQKLGENVPSMLEAWLFPSSASFSFCSLLTIQWSCNQLI